MNTKNNSKNSRRLFVFGQKSNQIGAKSGRQHPTTTLTNTITTSFGCFADK